MAEDQASPASPKGGAWGKLKKQVMASPGEQSPKSPASPASTKRQQRAPGTKLCCVICLADYETEAGKGETTKCGHMHQRCVDYRLKRNASARCPECRVKTITLSEDQELWEASVIAWMRGKYEECIEPTLEAIERDPTSSGKNRMMGDLYYEGKGLPKDLELAKVYYMAAKNGSDDHASAGHAAYRVGEMLLSEIKYEESLGLFEFAYLWKFPKAKEMVDFVRSIIECLEVLPTDRRALRRYSTRLRENWFFIRRAVEIQGFALDFACDALKNDEEIVFEAVKQNSLAFQFASEELRGSKEFVGRLLGDTSWQEDSPRSNKNLEPRGISVGSGWVLEWASEELKGDRATVLAAVLHSGGALKFASTRLQADKEVVGEACSQDGLALEHASAELQADAEVVTAAVKQNASAFKFASEALRGDSEFVLALIHHSSFAFRYASRELREDREFVMLAIKKDGLSLRWAYEGLREDPDLLLEAQQRCGWTLAQAPQELLHDHDFMLKAIAKNSQALNFASEEFRNDHQSLVEAVRTKGSALQFTPNVVRGDRGLVAAAVKQNCGCMYFADEELRADATFLNASLGPQIKRRSSLASLGSKTPVGSKASVPGRRASNSKRPSSKSPSKQAVADPEIPEPE